MDFVRSTKVSKPILINYQTCFNEGEAIELAELLKRNHIESFLDYSTGGFDPSFSNVKLNNTVVVKIQAKDITRADEVLASELDFDSINEDYYLLDLSVKDLKDILVKPDEWNRFDYLLAKKLLKDRNHHISETEVNDLQKQRIEQLAIPEKSDSLMVIVGYGFALLGGIIGILIGWILFSHKKRLPNGESVYKYTDKDRQHGKKIAIIGIIALISGVILRLSI